MIATMHRRQTSQRRGFARALAALLLFAAMATPAFAAPPDRFLVEIRVIEAQPGGGAQTVDPKLASLARDLKSLPFKGFKLIDAHQTAVSAGERVSVEFPGKTKRFISVAAHGRQAGGKLRFQLSIAELKFDTLVAVPEGGTIVVAGPKHEGATLMFALTARTQ